MARDWYSNLKQEAYSKWHRQFDGIAMIDVDSVECCKVCYEPLAIIADKMQLPAFVVLYTVEQEEITQFRIRRVSPQVSKTYRVAAPELWLSWLSSLQGECKSCSLNVEW